MKVLSIVLCLLLLLTGCASTAAKLDAVDEAVEHKLERAEDKIEMQIESVMPVPADTAALLTEEEAAAIAIEHAGLTKEAVGTVRVTYELDDGVPEYEVGFRVGTTGYDYTIHAETGEILSYEMDD